MCLGIWVFSRGWFSTPTCYPRGETSLHRVFCENAKEPAAMQRRRPMWPIKLECWLQTSESWPTGFPSHVFSVGTKLWTPWDLPQKLSVLKTRAPELLLVACLGLYLGHEDVHWSYFFTSKDFSWFFNKFPWNQTPMENFEGGWSNWNKHENTTGGCLLGLFKGDDNYYPVMWGFLDKCCGTTTGNLTQHHGLISIWANYYSIIPKPELRGFFWPYISPT